VAARRSASRPVRGRRTAAPSGSSAGTPAPAGLVWRAALLVAAGAAVYAVSLSAPFLFDDQNSIAGNRSIRQLSPLSVPLSPPDETPVAGRPVVNLSFALDYAAHGLDVRGFRAVNVAIHLLAALALFGVVRRTLVLPRLTERYGAASVPIAYAAALLWMLHPLQTESVNYLSQRTESLMGLFYFLTLYSAIRGWAVRAMLACALGMACKESMVTAPIAVLLYDRVFLHESLADAWRARRRLYLGLAAGWIVLGGLMLSGPRTSIGFSTGVSAWTYLLNQAVLVARYFWLTVSPRDLVLDYGLPQPLTLADVWLPGTLVVGLLILTLALLRAAPMLGFLGAWLFLTLAPTSSIVPIATEVGAERRMYVPLAAVAVLAAVAAYRATRGRGFAAVTAALCLLLAAGTVARNLEYESVLTIAQTIVERWPSGRGRFLLGTELIAAGRRDEGMAELRLSAREYPGARFALGTELLAEQKLDEAAVELQAFIAEMPGHPSVVPARDMLGRVFLAQDEFDQAVEQYRLLQQAAPNYRGPNNDVLLNLGYALAASGRLGEAVPVLERAVAANPNDTAARDLLARIRGASPQRP
jgi:Flp pilus assembly protein TadD